MLVELIDALYNDIGTGLNDATIRSRLDSIREEAEAVEASMKAAQARVKELEANRQAPKSEPEQEGLEEGAKNLLKLLFDAGRSLSIGQMADSLELAKSMADYHADALIKADMIEPVALTPAGTMYVLTAKGRAYVVKNKLV